MRTIKYAILALSIMTSASVLAEEVDMSCMETPANASEQLNLGGFDRHSTMMQGYKTVDDPASTLFTCFSMAADMNPKAVVSDRCGCLASIKKLCSFDWHKGKLKISASGGASAAWCVPFKFLAG